MAGKRWCIPNLDDEDTKINGDDYKNSPTVGDGVATTVKNEKNKQTEKISSSTPTEDGKVEITSPVSGCIDDIPAETQDKVLAANQKQSEIDKLKYIADNNPDYLEEMDISPDDLFVVSSSGDSGFTYQESEVVMDENGLTYLDENQPEFFTTQTDVQTGSQIFSGQPLIIPTNSKFSYPVKNFTVWGSKFGFRILPQKPWIWKFHAGTDISAEKGREVLAIYDGKIKRVNINGNGGGYGNFIQLNFSYGTRSFDCFYAHLNDVLVKKDDIVKKGQVIGHVGNTGGNYPYHLHFEIRNEIIDIIWTNPHGNITDVYHDNRQTQSIGDSLKFSDDVKTIFYPIDKYKYYIDPEKFFNNPTDYKKWYTQ